MAKKKKIDPVLFYTDIASAAQKSVQAGGFAMRIVGFGVKRASEFKPNKKNWRKHGDRQKEALSTALSSLGWIDVVVENRQTGNLIDGHLRIKDALENGDDYVPFVHIDISESEEALALLSLDGVAGMADTDESQVQSLMSEILAGNQDMELFLADLADSMEIVTPENIQGREKMREKDETIRPKAMLHVLVSVPVNKASDISEIIRQAESVEGAEVAYGAN